jgi:hypothetical protein
VSLRSERLTKLQTAYDLALDKTSDPALSKIGMALAQAKQAGASDRECMDVMRSRDWGRYKRYKDYAKEKGWL